MNQTELELAAERPRTTSRLTVIILTGALLQVFFLCLVPELVITSIMAVGYLAVGWFWFLQRVGPQIEFDPFGIAVAVAAFLALIPGLQYAIRTLAPQSSWPVSRTIRGALGVVGILLAGICLVGLGHELSWWGRTKEPWLRISSGWDAPQRTQSRNHLKQIGLAFHNYHDAFDSFPPGGIFESNGDARHGWMTAILPYVDHAPLYNTVNFGKPWHDEVNRTAYATRLPAYENPRLATRGAPPTVPYAPAHYAANRHVLHANRGLKILQFRDGVSNTIVAGEVKESIRPWGDAANWRSPELGINQSPQGFGSPFKGGANVLLGDGSVRFVSETISPDVLKALATPAAGDVAGEF